MVSSARTAESNQELLAMQREVDAIISETLERYDDGAIEEEELAALSGARTVQSRHRREARGIASGHARIGSRCGDRPQPHVSASCAMCRARAAPGRRAL